MVESRLFLNVRRRFGHRVAKWCLYALIRLGANPEYVARKYCDWFIVMETTEKDPGEGSAKIVVLAMPEDAERSDSGRNSKCFCAAD